MYMCVHMGSLTVNISRSFWGHSMHFSPIWLMTQKLIVVERNGRKFEPRDVYSMHISILTLNMSRSFRSLGVLFRKGGVTRKRLIVERNG